jgi:hypothetical protein
MLDAGARRTLICRDGPLTPPGPPDSPALFSRLIQPDQPAAIPP